MSRLPILLLVLATANSASALDRYIAVFTGNVGDRTFRTTVDLRSTTTEECRFELRAPDGAIFKSTVRLEANKPTLLDEFASEFQTFATTVKVSCSGDVDVHSRIHESKDNGVTYAEGSLFPAIVAEPLSSEVRTTPMPSDFIVAEVGGAPARVTGTLTAGKRISDKQWDLPAFGERAILVTDVIRAFGPMEANLRATGEGQVIIFSAITDPRSATVARRAPAAVRTAVTAANPPSITRQLGVASFKAAPFQDPLTGLVLMRDRWYDPTSGTFLTPDPEGYRDSSNAYVFCAGDPVNCSDPTGRAASVNTKGDIIGIRPGGSRYFISSAEAKADPVKALRLLESDTDLSFDKQEEIMRRAGLRIPISSACRPSERCLPGPEHSNPNAFTHLPSNGKWAEAAFVGTTGLPSQTREQELVSGGVQIVGVAVPAAAGIRARLRGGVGAGIQPVFGTRAGVPVGVNTFMSEVYGPSSPALLPSGVSPVDQYRSELAMDMGKPIVRDPELARILDKVYRPDATLWSGSTADAVRYERLSGRPVGGRWHTQKAQEAVSTLLIWMNKNPEISTDRAVAELVYRDLKQALSTPDVRTGN